MKLREVLIRTIERGNKNVRDMPLKSKLAKIVSDLEQKYSKSDAPPLATDLQQIRESFMVAERSNRWDGIDSKMWRKACWVLWAGGEPLAANKMFLDKYIE